MSNNATATGHIKCFNSESIGMVQNRINQLPAIPYNGPFSIWRGLFHAIEEPNIDGHLIVFGLSFKSFGEEDEIGGFLDFWEELIEGLPIDELFIAAEQEFHWSNELFGKFYFQWVRRPYPKSSESRIIFQGMQPIDINWQSRFESNLSS